MRRAAWLVLVPLVLVFVAVTAWLLYQRVAAGKDMPDYSVYSSGPRGLSGTAAFLTKIGYEPIAMTRPVQHTRNGGLLIMVEPSYKNAAPPIEEGQAKSILSWVEHGNTLLLAGRHMNALHEQLGLQISRDSNAESGSPARHDALPEDPTGYTRGIDHLEVEGLDHISAPSGHIVLWSTAAGAGALVMPHGAGRVIVVADPSVLTAKGLPRRDNVLFLYNVALLDAADDRIYFDEYHHGLRTEGGFWDYLRYYGQTWAVLPLALFLGVALWSVAIRLGPAVPRVEEQKPDAVAYASAIARIYQLADVRRLPGQTLVRDFLGALCWHLRIRKTTIPAQILASWKQRHGQRSSERLQDLLRAIPELRKGEVTPRRLLEWTQAFDEFLLAFSREPRRARTP
jgi:hypothetical protein